MMTSSLVAITLVAAFVAATPCLGFASVRMMATLPSTLNHVLAASPHDLEEYVTISGSGVIDVDGLMNVMSSSVLLSETEAWVQPLSLVLGPFLNFFSFAMVST